MNGVIQARDTRQDRRHFANVSGTVPHEDRNQRRIMRKRLDCIGEGLPVAGAPAPNTSIDLEQFGAALKGDLSQMIGQPPSPAQVGKGVVRRRRGGLELACALGAHRQPNTRSTTARRSLTFECR